MKAIFSYCIAMLCMSNLFAQHNFKGIVKSRAGEPLQGATASIAAIKKTAIADSNGLVIIQNIPPGVFDIVISFIGFEVKTFSISFPSETDSAMTIELQEMAAEEEEEEVIITATRTSRTIENIPTRVETISGEELQEKGNMKPGDIRMMLNESTGIQTQQTSATSYNSSIRIQGLDGRYTQLLRDGLPLYGGYAGGLSLMQIAPLDLKQVEVIKGSSSTLYGGGAIAGLVNLVSKTPKEVRELNFFANATSAKGLDLSGFYSQRFKNVGLTVFGSRNTASAYDPADIGLTAIPKFERYTINPRFFIYGNKTNANVGVSYITENRLGGSTEYIEHATPGYFEENKTQRFTGQADIQHQFNKAISLNFKSSYTRFSRIINIPNYIFDAIQQSSFTEINIAYSKEKTNWIVGANLMTDDLGEKKETSPVLRDYHNNTMGVFLQNTWTPNSKFSLETGLRADYVKQYGVEWLPRMAAMYKFNAAFTVRLGGGLGYKTPTLFNEESEEMHYQNILPINEHTTNNEKSAGANFDINYRTKFGEVGFSINQLFFYTRLNKPLVLTDLPGNTFEFVNAVGFMDTKGMETNLRFTYHDFKLFVGYTYADVNSAFDGVKSWFPLTAKHRLNNVLMYEKEEKLKIGVEAYYFSPQKLSDGAMGKSYWICGVMGEKLWEHFSIFLNFENILDARQTKFDTIYTGTITNPTFRDIYAPVDGFVVNGGLKLFL